MKNIPDQSVNGGAGLFWPSVVLVIIPLFCSADYHFDSNLAGVYSFVIFGQISL